MLSVRFLPNVVSTSRCLQTLPTYLSVSPKDSIYLSTNYSSLCYLPFFSSISLDQGKKMAVEYAEITIKPQRCCESSQGSSAQAKIAGAHAEDSMRPMLLLELPIYVKALHLPPLFFWSIAGQCCLFRPPCAPSPWLA